MTDNKKQLIKDILVSILENTTQTTTLEIKQHLRRLYPSEKWYQDDISDVVDEIYTNNTVEGLQYKDNGTHRIYSIGKSAINVFFTNKTALAKYVLHALKTVNGLITIEVSKSGIIEEKKYKLANYVNPIDIFGYIAVINEKGENRKLDPRKLVSLKLGNTKYLLS
jgi:hypothetical protein